jgi:hypothetical protein
MSRPIAALIIGALTLNFGACMFFSFLGSAVPTPTQSYPRIVQTTSTDNGSGGFFFIRSGSAGGGSSRSGGGTSFGK